LYCWGKENGANIIKSIDEGPFQIGTFRETLAECEEGALHLGPERPRVYSELSSKDKESGLQVFGDTFSLRFGNQTSANFISWLRFGVSSTSRFTIFLVAVWQFHFVAVYHS
nr:integrase, catalytic region, zinc finger, CCHC-type, peptidase aspartic, catalytic [Tanacetum cinerariifolium]